MILKALLNEALCFQYHEFGHLKHSCTALSHVKHFTPILHSLHWLPVNFRVGFKILLHVYKSRNGLARVTSY